MNSPSCTGDAKLEMMMADKEDLKGLRDKVNTLRIITVDLRNKIEDGVDTEKQIIHMMGTCSDVSEEITRLIDKEASDGET